MRAKPKEVNDHANSEEEKSEEFLNFERGLRTVLSLTPEQAKQVRDKTPEPKPKKGKTPNQLNFLADEW